MANVKNKTITVESLKALHDYNNLTFETKENVELLLNETKDNIEVLLNEKFDKPDNNIVQIENGGTSSNNGAMGLKNLLASGSMVLSSYQYGDELPEAGTVGRIFFKRLTD